MTQTTIRAATKADIPAIHGLVHDLAVYANAAHELIATVEEYEADFTAGIFQSLVAEQQGTVIGMALYYMSYSTWKGRMLYLEDFVVKQAHRRAGIGQLLFDALIREAKQQQCKLLKWQVLDWNEPALNFYRKNQAIIENDWYNGKVIFTT